MLNHPFLLSSMTANFTTEGTTGAVCSSETFLSNIGIECSYLHRIHLLVVTLLYHAIMQIISEHSKIMRLTADIRNFQY
jgi:hypothetical protein